MADDKITKFGPGPTQWAVGKADAARQASASLRGYIYQLHLSLAAWIRLESDGELHLEVAEDYAELLSSPDRLEQILHATQAKETSESKSVTLNSADVLKTIESLFSLQEANPGRRVRVTFLTTSPIGKENKEPLPCGIPALEFWQRLASGDLDDPADLLGALRMRFPEGTLGLFLQSCSPKEFMERLVERLVFACGALSWQEIEERSRERLVEIRETVQAHPSAARQAYDVLLGVVLQTAIHKGERRLDYPKFESTFREATAYAVASQPFSDLLAAALKPQAASPGHVSPPLVEKPVLWATAKKLHDHNNPPSLVQLFPGTSPAVRETLQLLSCTDRWITDASPDSNEQVRLQPTDLLDQSELHHLIYAAPGSGKSHVLWRSAEQLLGTSHEANDSPIPLLLSVGGLRTAKEVLQQLSDMLPGCSPEAVLRDSRVRVFIDGWSEFATGEDGTERDILLRKLVDTRVVACARAADSNNTSFRRWSLEPLSPEVVRRAANEAFPADNALNDDLADLLRIPLMLSLYLLLGGALASQGELIARFHQHVSKSLPEQFEDVLSDSVASVSLLGERSYNALRATLQKAATAKGFPNPLAVLKKLGTVTERDRLAIPVHDLYWSWLSGVGLFRTARIEEAVISLDTRESISLALESGECVSLDMISKTVSKDAVLAAALDSSRGQATMDTTFLAEVAAMFLNPHLPVRCRAATAALLSGKPSLVRKALDVISEVSAGRLHVPALTKALDPSILFDCKAALDSWLGLAKSKPPAGVITVIESIAAKGDARWLTWLEQMFHDNRLDAKLAVATAMACGGVTPKWGSEHLQPLIEKTPEYLRFISDRGVNVELAHWLAANYPKNPEGSFVGWWQINRVLVSCGNSQVFEELLARFPSMSTNAQEVLGMVIPQLGADWTAKFQKVAFAVPGTKQHHRLAETLSLEVDDATAYQWIANGYHETGWRVLIARYGANILPELLKHVPAALGGHQRIHALEAMRFLVNPPASLADELMSRLIHPDGRDKGITPKVGESLIEALARVRPAGLLALVRQCLSKPTIFGHYLGYRFLKSYIEWMKETGQGFSVAGPEGPLPFEIWYIAAQFVQDWDEHHSPAAIKLLPDVAVATVLGPLAGDEEKAKAILDGMASLIGFHAPLYDMMIDSSILAPMLPKVFADALNLVPPDRLLRLASSKLVKQDELFYQLRTVSDPAFTQLHVLFIQRVLAAPLNLDNIRSVANMLRNYARDELLVMLKPLVGSDGPMLSENGHWLLRETGNVRRELLIDERGHLLTSDFLQC
ncbi:hypothetical protein [Paraburkholderia bryophila]|uniref:Uncharacterized protein n=1 Tax=Paraburkholderia bryophila TaxID=420952 RepID=A0A7Y9WNL4_9BURK|nr:hypothetical protein [Paraburkholderia bryophila]NYH24235.1 hypothetical protein [Paraburkholderia bryophila]